jgi:hypothetical protein
MNKLFDHEQIKVFDPSNHDYIEVDMKIAPLLQAIWSAGIRTCNSCEENSPGIMWIEFFSLADIELFLKIIVQSLGNQIHDHPEAYDWFCYRILGYNGDNLNPWHYDAHPNVVPKRYNHKEIYPKNSLPLDIEISISVRFPHEDLPNVLNIIKSYRAKTNGPTEIDEVQWDKMKRYLPPQPSRGKRADERKAINGILYVLRTGCRWNEIPQRYGSYIVTKKIFQRWSDEGILDKILSNIEDGESYRAKLSHYLSMDNCDNFPSKQSTILQSAQD